MDPASARFAGPVRAQPSGFPSQEPNRETAPRSEGHAVGDPAPTGSAPRCPGCSSRPQEGTHFPRASAIVGRSQETFIDSSGRRRSLYGYAFGDLDHGTFYGQIRDIQFVEDKADSLRVRIVTNRGAERDQIQQTFVRRIAMASLEFEYVSSSNEAPAVSEGIS